ncbi:L-ribulokinase [Lipingzhangella halophila]|uniref:Ribulokinase n=1 Tax=Lipingzhangella halophila TaxID=1783352 RepID=A0A7W7RE77_9ACTN|nr:ribulokinase [Lipingzhangella halophila]MBB4930351.1 L-ribulokinase [Lipingzhangella halophila]
MNPIVSANNPEAVVIGVDFGTLSGRAVVVRVADGAELASAVHDFEHGAVTEALPESGVALAPDTALQVPDDYRAVLRQAVPKALAASGVPADRVIGIGTDFTASTFLPTTADGTPLCELSEFADRPHAYPKLWKHHSAQPEADDVNALAEERGEHWLARYGGRISAEWEFPKALQVLREDPEVYDRAERFIEASDWIIWQLCGSENRSACVAGYKGIHQDGAWPSREYLAGLDPRFAGFVADKLAHPLSQLGERAGGLTRAAAAVTGLPEGIAVAVGNVDAHVTAAAAQTVRPGEMLAIMGTSTCHVLNATEFAEVPGMCGAVRDGIATGSWGFEAGQSGVGDIFAWFADGFASAEYASEAAGLGITVHELLSRKAAEQPVGAHGLVALDWHNGNRSVLVDHGLSGVVAGMTLATRPEEIYRALIESTAFGTRAILDAFRDSGVPVDGFTVAGGLKRNDFVLRIYADVLNRPLHVADSDQGPALGAAIHAAVAAGAYPDVPVASEAMGSVTRDAVLPDPVRAAGYDDLYAIYADLHDHFGRGGTEALHRLRRIRNENRTS